MREIALHILDIAQNSVTAGATVIGIDVLEDLYADTLTVIIKDNGCGMSEEFLERVIDPFTTKRTTRKVGLGIPLFKLAAEVTGGSFKIESEVNKGTTVTARFIHSSIDRQPLGNIAETLLGLVTSYENVNFVYTHRIGEKEFVFNTAEIKGILGDIPLSTPDVYVWLSEYIADGEEELI